MPQQWRAEPTVLRAVRTDYSMVGESFEVEEWDAAFLNDVIQAEERALSTQRSAQPPPPPFAPPPTPFAPLPPPFVPPPQSFSPPRFSQRTRDTGGVPDSITTFGSVGIHFARDEENDRLKKELHGVSQHLHHLEEEIVELRRERDKKEELLKDLHSKFEARDAEFQHTKNVETQTAAGTSKVCEDVNSSSPQLGSLGSRSLKKLFRLWNSDDEKRGRVLVAKLYMTCEADFHMLFGYLNSPRKDSNKGTPSVETAKVSQLYSVLNKLQISYDTLRLGDLLGALADLCNLKNVVIVRSSIRILHNVLGSSLSLEKEFGKRENVTVEEHSSEDINSDTNGSGDMENELSCFTNLAEMLKQGQFISGLELPNIKTPGHTGFFDHTIETSIPGVLWVSLFETMCLVSTENNEEQIQREAVSILNLILMRQNAYSDRDKFAGEVAFRSLSKLLRREAGFFVQDQAIHSLYLLCNCPKVIPMLCSGIDEDSEQECPNGIKDKSSTFHWLNEILIGLADCVAFYGSFSAQEMKLRKNAITLLAFIGSAGKSGFEILLSHKLPKGTNFFAIILQSLTSDLNPQALNSAEQSGIVKEQCLLIREALIFLNRLVSHSDYSVPVLQALTNTREMASTTVDVANRLTQNSGLLWTDISSKKYVRESEITDLARIFKKRVYTFLGDSIA